MILSNHKCFLLNSMTNMKYVAMATFAPLHYQLPIRRGTSFWKPIRKWLNCHNLSAANLPIICYLQSTVTSKFTEYLLFTVDCHQQIYRIFAIDSRLSPATPFKKYTLCQSVVCPIINAFSCVLKDVYIIFLVFNQLKLTNSVNFYMLSLPYDSL